MHMDNLKHDSNVILISSVPAILHFQDMRGGGGRHKGSCAHSVGWCSTFVCFGEGRGTN